MRIARTATAFLLWEVSLLLSCCALSPLWMVIMTGVFRPMVDVLIWITGSGYPHRAAQCATLKSGERIRGEWKDSGEKDRQLNSMKLPRSVSDTYVMPSQSDLTEGLEHYFPFDHRKWWKNSWKSATSSKRLNFRQFDTQNEALLLWWGIVFEAHKRHSGPRAWEFK